MYTVGMSDLVRAYFSCATLVIGVPTGIKIFAWCLSLKSVSLHDVYHLIICVFLSCFVFGGFTGLVLANASLDFAFHDTYFVVGHFHYVLSIAAAYGLLLFTLKSLKPESYVRKWSKNTILYIFSVILTFSVNTLFLLQHSAGFEGHPRRIFNSAELYLGAHLMSNFGILTILIVLVFLRI